MKRILFIIALVSLASLTVCGQDEKAEKSAIKQVIERETTTFFNVDQANWAVNWLDVPYAVWSYADSTGGSAVEGAENIRKNFNEYFRTAKPTMSRINREWLEIRLYGKGAYVRFIQKAGDGIDVDVTSETRVLEKDKDGKWKIICLVATAKYGVE
jgi:ketosteroid isomerase-like protein